MTAELVTLPDRWTGIRASDGRDSSAAPATADLTGILDTVEVPIVVLDHDALIGGFNQAAGRILGLALSDIGRFACDAAALRGIARLDQQCADVLADGVETRVDLRNGDHCFVVRIAPYRKGGSRPTGTVLTFTDVTAFRGSIEQAIYERECTKLILNTVADPLVVLSADHRILTGNRSFYGMFGVSRDETQGVPLGELASGAFAPPSVRAELDALLSGTRGFMPTEFDGVTTASGRRTLTLDARPLAFPGHPERRLLVTFQDITTRKQAEAAKDLRSEEELRRSEAFLAEGQRLSSTGSFSWKVATDEIAWSDELFRIYELEPGLRVTLERIRTRVHPEDLALLERMAQQAREGIDDFEWQYRLVMPDGSIKYLHAVAHASRDQEGQLEYIAAVQDVTARRRSEDALAKARSELAKVWRVTSLGVLTASIAHEVNQPLAGIVTNASTCLRMLDADPPNIDGARETARRTIRDGNRASDVITRLRALFSKEDEYTLELLNLNEITREVIVLSLSDLTRNGVALQHELAQDLPALTGDRIQLQQVILNLLRNASDAMVDVHDRPRRVVIRTERDGEHVKLSVQDVGVGVDAGSMTKMLDAFYTTKPDGMGIGLSVSRSIIERHNGQLWAAPNDGPGATFGFSIPFHPDAPSEPE